MNDSSSYHSANTTPTPLKQAYTDIVNTHESDKNPEPDIKVSHTHISQSSAEIGQLRQNAVDERNCVAQPIHKTPYGSSRTLMLTNTCTAILSCTH